MGTIKVIIADDNKVANDFIRKYLEEYEEFEVLGSCYTDEEEIFMIENLKPEIVITDIVRNNTSSGLEIIEKYKCKADSPKFLVITAGGNDCIDTKIMDGYIKKPINDYNLIVEELKRIKQQIISEKLPVINEKEEVNIINNMWYKLKEKLRRYIKEKK